MTVNQFAFYCQSRTLDPEMVLENEKIKEALLDRDDEKVFELLDSEF
jgi:hypothetical protein